jgi:5-formyltetrahydrofolate cyclo-ligase
MGVREAKRALRRRIKDWRDALAPAERDAMSERVARRVFDLPAYRRARCVLTYAAFGSEVGTDAITARVLAEGKRLVLPRVTPEGLVLHRVDDLKADLVAGVWGIPEPDPERPVVAPGEVDLFLLPGVAFDSRGRRLGYGRGYFDRTLAEARGEKAALAFDGQVVEQVPAGPADVPMDWVVTPTRLVRCGAAAAGGPGGPEEAEGARAR